MPNIRFIAALIAALPVPAFTSGETSLETN
jgi:hypothetical protein